jgi:outer membrane protein TolC
LIDRQTLLENIELAKVNVKNVTLKHQLGMESDFNLNQAKESLKTYQSQLSNIDISIRNAKEVLNQYLGFSVKNDIFIEYDLKYVKIPDNVTTHISTRTGGEDPKLKIEWRGVEYYRYVQETYDPETEESKIKIDNDVLTAERKYNDLVISYEKSIREKYNQLKQLEERRLQLEIDFNLAKETYNKAVVNFETGMITLYDTLNAKLNYLKLEGDLLKNQIDYDNLKFAYERPYLS